MKTRVISAVIGVLVITGLYVFGRDRGLVALASLVTLGALREYARLAFKPEESPRHIRLVFALITSTIFGCVLVGFEAGLMAFAMSAVVYLAMTLLAIQRKEDLGGALYLQSMGLLGFIYCGLMPALATKTILLPLGDRWFFGLLAIVFSGDTCAYLVGRKIGKTRLLEVVSPKKTIEGALGGLAGSGLAGLAMSYFLPGPPTVILVATAVVTGVFAQLGDLFESLLKRVAAVKDSGTIMPGHGGLLDRVDGVFFAAPVYFILVRFLVA